MPWLRGRRTSRSANGCASSASPAHRYPAAPDPTNAAKGSTPSPVRPSRRRPCRPSTTELSRGDAFDIVSRSPRFDPAVLAAATSLDPGDPIYLDLPDDFPDDAAALAREVTAGAANSYDSGPRPAELVQIGVHLQPGGPAGSRQRRDRGVPPRQGRLLRTVRRHLRGDDAVARHPGPRGGRVHHRANRSATGQYSVTGRNAHAWPEVWFDGLGWVLFEPTPGRGAPGAESYTGVEAAQDTSTGTQQDGVQPTPDEAATDPARHRADHAAPDSGGRRPRRTDPSGTARLDRNSIERRWQRVDPVGTPRRDRCWPWPRRRSGDGSAGVRGGRRANSWRTTGIGRSMPCVSSTCRSSHRPRRPKRRSSRSGRSRSCRDRCVRSPTRSRSPRMPRTGRSTSTTSGPTARARSATRSHWARQIERAVNDSVPKRVRVYRYFTNWK